MQKTTSLVESLDTATTHFNAEGAATLKNLAQLSDDLARGTGTLGRLFNSVDTIQTSLGRLSELLERAGGDSERERVLQSDGFKKDFLRFLNQAQSLSDSIKLYSQKLVQTGD